MTDSPAVRPMTPEEILRAAHDITVSAQVNELLAFARQYAPDAIGVALDWNPESDDEGGSYKSINDIYILRPDGHLRSGWDAVEDQEGNEVEGLNADEMHNALPLSVEDFEEMQPGTYSDPRRKGPGELNLYFEHLPSPTLPTLYIEI